MSSLFMNFFQKILRIQKDPISKTLLRIMDHVLFALPSVLPFLCFTLIVYMPTIFVLEFF